MQDNEDWSLLLDNANAENLLFHYPKSLEDDEYGNRYVKAENNINRVERVKERLSRSPIGKEAIQNINLLNIVANHKAFYYRSNAAKYDEAKAGSLKIVPQGEILEAFRIDYEKMRSMFTGAVIDFDTIIAELRILEEQINSLRKFILHILQSVFLQLMRKLILFKCKEVLYG